MTTRAPGRPGGLGGWLLRIPLVRRSVLEPIDTTVFQERPRGRVAVGLALVSVASLMGIPLVSVLALLATWLGAPWLGTLGAAAAYAASFPLFFLGLWLSGPAAMAFASATVRLALRALVRPWLRANDLAPPAADGDRAP